MDAVQVVEVDRICTLYVPAGLLNTLDDCQVTPLSIEYSKGPAPPDAVTVMEPIFAFEQFAWVVTLVAESGLGPANTVAVEFALQVEPTVRINIV